MTELPPGPEENVNYPENKNKWRPGKIVLHEFDAKTPKYFVEVWKYHRDGSVSCHYINKDLVCRQRLYRMAPQALLDPKIFGFDLTRFSERWRLEIDFDPKRITAKYKDGKPYLFHGAGYQRKMEIYSWFCSTRKVQRIE